MGTKAKSTRMVLRQRRKKRVRAKVWGTSERPRLSVFRSNRYIYAELIDDETRKTLAQANDRTLTIKTVKKTDEKHNLSQTPRMMRAYKVGEVLAEKAKEKSITRVVFDKSYYKYHGKVRALAEGARAGGLQF